MPAPQTVAQVEFYWPTYNPTEAFDFFEQTPVENVILRGECRSTTQATQPEPFTSGCVPTNCTSSIPS